MRTLLIGALLAAPIAAKSSVTALHAVPGLDDVDVFVNNTEVLSDIDYTDNATLSVDAGKYTIEIKKDNKLLLSLKDVEIKDNSSYTVVAHLDADGKPKLSAYMDDISKLDRGKARLIVRHLAQAPAVDVVQRRWFWQTVIFKNVKNGGEGAVDLRAGSYYVQLNPTGSRKAAFGPAKVSLEAGKIYRVHAIGKLGEKNFQLKILETKPGGGSNPTKDLVGMVRGKACGGMIGISKTSLGYDEEFEVTLKGAAKSSAGLLHMGMSDSRLFILPLPLSLDRLGLKGCSLYQSTEMIMGISTDANGASSYKTKIPASMKSRFKELHFQYSFVDGKTLKLTDYASVEKK